MANLIPCFQTYKHSNFGSLLRNFVFLLLVSFLHLLVCDGVHKYIHSYMSCDSDSNCRSYLVQLLFTCSVSKYESIRSWLISLVVTCPVIESSTRNYTLYTIYWCFDIQYNLLAYVGRGHQTTISAGHY